MIGSDRFEAQGRRMRHPQFTLWIRRQSSLRSKGKRRAEKDWDDCLNQSAGHMSGLRILRVNPPAHTDACKTPPTDVRRSWRRTMSVVIRL